MILYFVITEYVGSDGTQHVVKPAPDCTWAGADGMDHVPLPKNLFADALFACTFPSTVGWNDVCLTLPNLPVGGTYVRQVASQHAQGLPSQRQDHPQAQAFGAQSGGLSYSPVLLAVDLKSKYR